MDQSYAAVIDGHIILDKWIN